MGFRLSKIYTRTGDKGETGLGDGRRVPKDHPRIEAIGEVDTLNSQVGVLLAGLAAESGQFPGLNEVIEVLAPCQHRLFDLGGELAMPVYQALNAAEIERLERLRWQRQPMPDHIELLFDFSASQLTAEHNWIAASLTYMRSKP